MTETIICAANYYDDGIVYTFNPSNITKGFIICGHRHHNCIQVFAKIYGFPYSDEAHQIHNTEIQGFLTNTNRFVDRKEAMIIAKQANQVNETHTHNSVSLYSEDLY